MDCGIIRASGQKPVQKLEQGAARNRDVREIANIDNDRDDSVIDI